MKPANLLMISLLTFLLLFGCTEQIPSAPYSTSQFVNRSTDLNYIKLVQGDYNGKLIYIDHNVLSARDVNQIVLIESPIDTNTQTAGWTNSAGLWNDLKVATDINVGRDENINRNLYVKGNLKVDGNMSIKRPYGLFSSMKTQTVASAGAKYYMDFNTTEDSYLITKLTDNNFMMAITGDYKVEISIIAKSASAGTYVNIWVEKNGVALPRSNTRYDFKSNNAIAVIAVPFIIDMTTTDKFSIMYSGSSTNVSLPALDVDGNAPETPSAIMTIDKISELT